MKTCPNCKNTVNDNELFCPNCGTRVDAEVQQTPDLGATYQQAPQQDYSQPQYDQQYQQQGNYYAAQPVNQGLNTTPYLVWSIINILFCCWPLSIWSLILSINANKKPTLEQAQADLKKAKTICLISSIGGGVFMIFYVILMVIAALAESGAF